VCCPAMFERIISQSPIPSTLYLILEKNKIIYLEKQNHKETFLPFSFLEDFSGRRTGLAITSRDEIPLVSINQRRVAAWPRDPGTPGQVLFLAINWSKFRYHDKFMCVRFWTSKETGRKFLGVEDFHLESWFCHVRVGCFLF